MSEIRSIKFTQSVVDRLPAPEGGRIIYWDATLPGFGLRISPPRQYNQAVRKVWIAMYRVVGRQVMETIGPMYLIPDLSEARTRARDSMRIAHDQGVNPVVTRREKRKAALAAAERQAARMLPAVIDKFLTEYEKSPKKKGGEARKPNTIRGVKGNLGSIKSFQPTKVVDDITVNDGDNWAVRYLDEITRAEWKTALSAIGETRGPIASNQVLGAAKQLYKWAMQEEIIAVNPLAELSPLYPAAGRERYLSDAEIRAFWWACGQIYPTYCNLFKVLLLTATRRNEAAELPLTGELDFADRVWTLPPERNKTGVWFLIPLVEQVIQLIQSAPRTGSNVFSGPNGGINLQFAAYKQRVDDLMLQYLKERGEIEADGELKPWVLHDLRRTARTNMGRIGIDDNIGERLLNHTVPGVLGIYNRWEYLDKKRDALERWTNLLMEIVESRA